MKQSHVRHSFQNSFLFCLGIFLAPFTTAIILAIFLYNSVFKRADRLEHAKPAKRILVTGVSMSKGLAIARLFHQQGHTVIGADVDVLACGRVSRAVRKFYHLPAPDSRPDTQLGKPSKYVQVLLHIAKTESIDLWVSVSGVDSAVQDSIAKDVIERLTPARAIQFDSQHVGILDAKDAFIDYIQNQGLKVPESHRIRDKDDLISFLVDRGGLVRKPGSTLYLIKPVGVNDAARLDMPLLPLPTEKKTLSRIRALSFGANHAYIAQEFIQGNEYCTHSLVIRGRVRAFVACQSSDVLMHYQALPEDSSLSKSMRQFTIAVAKHGGDDFTGHLSFDFMAKPSTDRSNEKPEEIYPIECNPRVHTAVVLYGHTPQLANIYLSALNSEVGGGDEILYPQHVQRYYWFGQDMVEKLFCPLYRITCHGVGSIEGLISHFASFAEHVLYWKDGTFEVWDPWPFWWLYHVQWPARLMYCLMTGKKWEKANVSTGKMFKPA